MRKKQYKELIKRLDRIEQTLLAVHEHMNDCAKFACEKSASELIQEGIDNIMGFQWPPKGGGNK